MRLCSFGCAFVAGLAVLTPGIATMATSSAAAAPTDARAAQALFDDAVANMKARDFAAACPKLEEVTRLVPSAVGAHVELGKCYEEVRRFASAWSEWSAVEALARNAGQQERESKAGERIRALKPKLSYLTLKLSASAASLSGIGVERDGVEVGRAQWGTRIPVDGGEHVVVAHAPGFVDFRQIVRVAAQSDNAVVEIDRLVSEAGRPQASTLSPSTIDAGETRKVTRPWQRPVGIAVTALGGAGLVVGTILGSFALSKYSESNDAGCTPGTASCEGDESVALRRAAFGLANGSTIAFIAGGLLAAGGITLWATAPRASTTTTALRVSPSSITLDGSF